MNLTTKKKLLRNGPRSLMVALCGWTVCAICSCTADTAANAFREIPATGWESDDTLRFDVDSVHTGGTYVATLSLRLSAARPYPFRTLVAVVERHIAGLPERTDTLEMSLMPGARHATGHGVSLVQYDFPLDTLGLEVGDKGYYTVRHAMRRSPLPGIADVGMSVRALRAQRPIQD